MTWIGSLIFVLAVIGLGVEPVGLGLIGVLAITAALGILASKR